MKNISIQYNEDSGDIDIEGDTEGKTMFILGMCIIKDAITALAGDDNILAFQYAKDVSDILNKELHGVYD